MTLDVRTLGLISVILPFVLGLILTLYWRERRTYKGFERWVLANFVFGVGYLLISMRGFIPDFWSILVGNAATVYAEILIFEGIRLFYGRPAFSKWNSLVFLLYLLVHSYFVFYSPNINARIIVISLVLFVLIFRSGLNLINHPRPELQRTSRSAGIIFLITALLPLFRAGYTMLQTQPIDLFQDKFSAWFALLGLVSILIWTYYFFIINSARLELDLETARLELVQLAMTDPLTGLYNRRHFLERAELEIQRAKREKLELSFLLMDIDGFKEINDQFGHDSGDTVMQQVASTLPREVRGFDVVARFGGDEFIALLANVGKEQAQEVAERIRLAVTREVMISELHPIHIGISVGIASFESNDEDLKMILKRADDALYQAKRGGRNRVQIG
ncbi:MAG: GGDEF domain-containing protein [Anaerolineales bacterium]